MGSHHTFNLCLAYERKIKEKKVRRIERYYCLVWLDMRENI
jgi:hypothetical protein